MITGKITLKYLAEYPEILSMVGFKDSLATHKWEEEPALLVKVTLDNFDQQAQEAHNATSWPVEDRYWSDTGTLPENCSHPHRDKQHGRSRDGERGAPFMRELTSSFLNLMCFPIQCFVGAITYPFLCESNWLREIHYIYYSVDIRIVVYYLRASHSYH